MNKKELTPLKALEKICEQACKDRDELYFLNHKNCKETEENAKYVPYCNGCPYCSGNENYKIVKQALKEHEEYKVIEEEIGIDLITLVKILNSEQIYWETSKGEIKEAKFNFISKNTLRLHSVDVCFKFKDYGKTWAFTREELL